MRDEGEGRTERGRGDEKRRREGWRWETGEGRRRSEKKERGRRGEKEEKTRGNERRRRKEGEVRGRRERTG